MRWLDTALNAFGMTTLINQTTRFVGQHSSPRFLDFVDRYSNRMKGCVEPQHSRADRGMTLSGSTAARGSRRQKSARSQFGKTMIEFRDLAQFATWRAGGRQVPDNAERLISISSVG